MNELAKNQPGTHELDRIEFNRYSMAEDEVAAQLRESVTTTQRSISRSEIDAFDGVDETEGNIQDITQYEDEEEEVKTEKRKKHKKGRKVEEEEDEETIDVEEKTADGTIEVKELPCDQTAEMQLFDEDVEDEEGFDISTYIFGVTLVVLLIISGYCCFRKIYIPIKFEGDKSTGKITIKIDGKDYTVKKDSEYLEVYGSVKVRQNEIKATGDKFTFEVKDGASENGITLIGTSEQLLEEQRKAEEKEKEKEQKKIRDHDAAELEKKKIQIQKKLKCLKNLKCTNLISTQKILYIAIL
jgi:hypothetical protein